MSTRPSFNAQRGFVLMAAALLLGIAVAAVLLGNLSARQVELGQEARTPQALDEAKQAVLGYMLLDDTSGGTLRPGSIPCPDANNDGASNLPDNYGNNCSGSYVNRFPSKNFRTGDLRDAANEKLWYAISAQFRSGATSALNSSTSGTLTLGGQGEYVAVIFAPGRALPGQSRADPSNRAHFLESTNAVSQTGFVSEAGASSPAEFNDRLIGISFAEWEKAVVPSVANEVARALIERAVHRPGTVTKTSATVVSFPWAAPFSMYTVTPSSTNAWAGQPSTERGLLPAATLWSNSDWAYKNEWYKFAYYVIAPAFAAGGAGNCNDPSQCLTLVKENKTITNIKALIILAGRPIGSQLRSTAPTVSDFIEGAVNLDNDNVFATVADGSNDYFYAIL